MKPQWQEAAPSFHLNVKQDEELLEPFSLKNEQSYGKGVSSQTQDLEGNRSGKKARDI